MLVALAVGVACSGFVAAMLGFRTAPAAGRERAAGATVVTVTAGKPREFAFKLSKTSVLPWQAPSSAVIFRVTNRGALSHRFKVCATPVATAKLTACSGTSTRLLEPGQSATLRITFRQRGKYEYLSSVPGQAARGMKGLIGIGVSLTASTPATTTTKPTTTTPSTPSTPATTTTPSAPTTTSPPSPAPTGDPVAGAAVWVSAGCGSCHSLSEIRGSGVPSDLNVTHPGPFNNGPLTPTQLSDLAAYVARSTG